MTNKKRIMKKFGPILAAITVVVAIFISGCSGDVGPNPELDPVNPAVSQVSYVEDGNETRTETGSEAGGEHSSLGEGSEAGGAADGGEESGTRYALNDTYDVVRKGARLTMVYDAQENAFFGIVANTTNSTLQKVRVEVHLSNGTELGPTSPVDLAPADMTYVALPATDQPFDGWTPHAEVGTGEHGSQAGEGGSEAGGEHGGFGEGSEASSKAGSEADGEHSSLGEGAVTISQSAHERDSGEAGESEESGTEYALDQTYDVTRNGARLVLVYDAQNNAFIGAVANTTNSTLSNVRVEVHLSNGTELGPTNPVDLPPGTMMQVVLPATSEAFDGWSAHPEVGGGEAGGEHSSGSSGEHGGFGSEGNEAGGEHGGFGESSGEHGGGSEGRGG